MLNKLSELITLIKNDPQIERFKELEKIVDRNESINNDFNKLLELQKVMVQKEYRHDKTLSQAQENYRKQLQVVANYPIIEEYLELLEYINTDLDLIKSIIEQEIALDFD